MAKEWKKNFRYWQLLVPETWLSRIVKLRDTLLQVQAAHKPVCKTLIFFAVIHWWKIYNEHVKISNEHCIICFFFSVICIVKSMAEIHKAYRQRFKEKNNDEYLSKERVLRRETTLLITNISYICLFVFLIEFLWNNHIWLILRLPLLFERFRCKI